MNNLRGVLLITLLGLVVWEGIPNGHTPISSRYNYNEHVFPIFMERCGSCHINGGIAPMSLVEYQAAYPWTQAIREEVLGLRMPPWQAEDGFGDFKNGHSLSPNEMDIILEWSSGGYPQGPRNLAPEQVAISDGWTLGEPTVDLEMTEPFLLDRSDDEVIRYFVIPSGTTKDNILTAVDFRPGASSIVRGALVFIDPTGEARTLEKKELGLGFSGVNEQDFPNAPPVGVYTPGQPSVINSTFGYHFPAGSDLVVRIHYKKTWITKGLTFEDRSRVGLHFADREADTIKTVLALSSTHADERDVSFNYRLSQARTVVSLFPDVSIPSTELKIVAITPDGLRVPMLWLNEPDANWPTRFWFETPVSLPAGSDLEISAKLNPFGQRTVRDSLVGDSNSPVRVAIDYLDNKVATNN